MSSRQVVKVEHMIGFIAMLNSSEGELNKTN